MSHKTPAQHKFLEIVLIVICVALCCLLYRVGKERMVVLNLFYLPVVLCAFFLGRYRAGVLALFCMVSVSVVIALNLDAVAVDTSPLIVGLVLTIWGAVLGINAILVGTLSDESNQRIEELHDAYLGVVEVLGPVPQQRRPETQRPRGQGLRAEPAGRSSHETLRHANRQHPRGRLAARHRKPRSDGPRHSQGDGRPHARRRERRGWSTLSTAAISSSRSDRCSPAPCPCWSATAIACIRTTRRTASRVRRAGSGGGNSLHRAEDI